MNDIAFDLSDVCHSRVGVACTEELEDGMSFTSTRFADVDRLSADDRGLLLVVRFDDGTTEAVHHSRVTYIDGKLVP